jgi:hypothetical protein
MSRLTVTQIAEKAKALKVSMDKLVAIPSIGTQLNHVNASLQDNLYNAIEKHNHEVISIKTADSDFTYTFGSKRNSINFEYDTRVVNTFSGKPVKTHSSIIFRFRLAGENFFKTGDLTDLYRDMARGIRHEVMGRISCINNDDICRKIELSIDRRIKNGTSFHISSIVTRCRETGKMQHWHKMQVGGMFKMVLYAFKEATCVKEYTVVSMENQHLWEEYAGELWTEDCLAINDKKDKFKCAYHKLKLY